MKVLSATTERDRKRPWQQPILLLEVRLYKDKFSATPTTFVFRASDTARVELGEYWLGMVESWGNVGDAINAIESDSGGTIATLSVQFANHVRIGPYARFTDMIRHGRLVDGFDVPFGEATLYMIFRGGVVGDQVKVFDFLLEEFESVTDSSLTLHMSGMELGSEDRDDLLRITTDVWPFAAPSSIGKKVPLLIGRLHQAPVLWPVAGILDKLRTAMTPTDPPDGGRIECSQPALLARLPPAGRMQVDFEQIQYTAVNLTTISLDGITRGVNATTKDGHSVGASVAQVMAQFIAIVGQNKPLYATQNIGGVYYLDGTLKDPNTPPRHVVVLHDLELWPPYDLNTVYFEGTESV